MAKEEKRSNTLKYITMIVALIVVAFIAWLILANNSTVQKAEQPSNCSDVYVGTSGSGNSGGNCANFAVEIGTYGTYTNFGNACPSEVLVGTYGIYYDNVSGCNPQVELDTGAKEIHGKS